MLENLKEFLDKNDQFVELHQHFATGVLPETVHGQYQGNYFKIPE